MLQDYFNGKHLNKSINQNESVALGAAIQAAIINKDISKKIENLILLDTIPVSIGIETVGGVFSILIPKNSTCPCKKTLNFSTNTDNQTSVLIQLFEGENNLTKDNYSITKMNFDGLPPGPKGSLKIFITIDIDAYLNITLMAFEKSTKKEKKDDH